VRWCNLSELFVTVSSELFIAEISELRSDARKKQRQNQASYYFQSHARHGFSRLWYGSVADEIVDAAPCAVLVLKMPQAKH
jgi:hypothetical protein